MLETVKTLGGSTTLNACRTNQQGNFYWNFQRHISRPLSGSGTISGTFDFINQVSQAWEDDVDPPANSVVAVWKVHVYVTVGNTTAVRGTLVNNYVDNNAFPFSSVGGVVAVAITQQTVTNVNYQDGDRYVVEWGPVIVSSPTPSVSYPPTNQSFLPIRTGVTGAFPTYTDLSDMTVGDTAARAPWCEFSANLSFKAGSAAPANETCAAAITIASLPYESSLIDTTGGTAADQEVYWRWTAPTSGTVFFHTLGSNNGNRLRAFTGACGSLVSVPGDINSEDIGMHRGMASTKFEAVAGTTYTLKITTLASTRQAPSGGGAVKLSGFYVDSTPETDDLFIPAGWLVQFRPSLGSIVNMTPIWLSNAPTAVAIDYTRRAMDDLSKGVPNTNEKLFMGLHATDLAEVLDISDFEEIDFINAPWDTSPPFIKHPYTFHFTRDGELVVGWGGNGYSYVKGVGTLPAILNRISSDAIYSDIRVIDGTHADTQAGAPWAAATRLSAAVQITATPWLTVDEDNEVIYYISSGLYEPVGGNTIKRITMAGVQMPDLVTLSLLGSNNPGLKGLVISGDSLFVCNGISVQRINKLTGAIVTTYTPTQTSEAQSLCDVKVSADGLSIYVFDENTTALFKFNVATAAQENYWQLRLLPGSFTQMARYATSEEPPTPEVEECPITTLLLEGTEPDSALERLFEVHGFGIAGQRSEEVAVVAQIAGSDFSGILGDEELAEFVLGDEAMTVITSEVSGEDCFTIESEPDNPLRGIL